MYPWVLGIVTLRDSSFPPIVLLHVPHTSTLLQPLCIHIVLLYTTYTANHYNYIPCYIPRKPPHLNRLLPPPRPPVSFTPVKVSPPYPVGDGLEEINLCGAYFIRLRRTSFQPWTLPIVLSSSKIQALKDAFCSPDRYLEDHVRRRGNCERRRSTSRRNCCCGPGGCISSETGVLARQ